jgi:Predicted membrane protein (DUF2142)
MTKNSRDNKIINLFCIFAAIRVFIYSATFPFFTIVDEEAHFDLVMKYSKGHIPSYLEKTSVNSAEYIAWYGSPEYLYKSNDLPFKKFPPPFWTFPKEKVQRYVDGRVAFWSAYTNHESSQPPLYYSIAGIWADLGSMLGLNGGWFLYWIRFLNVFLIVGFVWIAYRAASMIFPENRFIVFGVPLLAAFLPQDTFYSIQNDVLSPICFGLAFVSIVQFIKTDIPSRLQGILAGLAMAATVLVKSSNLVLLVIAIVIALFMIRRLSRAKKLVPATVPIILFALCALVPVFVWFTWNVYNYGDLTASECKIQFLGWTHKSFFDWFNHPIFTIHGVSFFWSELMASFWRGEFVWSLKPLAMPIADVFYWLSSSIFVVLAVIRIRLAANDLQRRMNWIAFWSFVSIVFFMVFLSVSFDFGECFYPSQKLPYFISGRLVNVALIPFLLLYVQGMDWSLSWIKNARYKFGILILIVICITVSELIVNWPVFFSQYNFFHL